jgi:hypothetical protein
MILKQFGNCSETATGVPAAFLPTTFRNEVRCAIRDSALSHLPRRIALTSATQTQGLHIFICHGCGSSVFRPD